MIIWVNDYCLSENLLRDLQQQVGAETARRLYILDKGLMQRQHMGLKRLSMIHARALHLGCEILVGDCAEILADLASDGGAVATYQVPCPYWGEAQQAVASRCTLIAQPLPVFIEPPKTPKLKRFMGFWKPIEKLARDPATWIDGKHL